MSPLQFQKQIRLQEARRLMLGEDLFHDNVKTALTQRRLENHK